MAGNRRQLMHRIQPIPFDARVDALLAAHHLPSSDLRAGSSARLFGSVDDGRLLGVVGLEWVDAAALLRSLVVPEAARGGGLGGALVAHAEQLAIGQGIAAMYLLTETAEGFFERLGYRRADRAAAPPAIAATTQFSSLCPASSAFMAKSLQG